MGIAMTVNWYLSLPPVNETLYYRRRRNKQQLTQLFCSAGHWETLWPLFGGVVGQGHLLGEEQHRRRVAPGSRTAPRRDHVLVAVSGHLFRGRHAVLLPCWICGRLKREVSDWASVKLEQTAWPSRTKGSRRKWRHCWSNHVVAPIV